MTDAAAGRRARVGVAVPAAGSGERMGGARKPFLELEGEPVLAHALRPFLADQRVTAVVVALAESDAADPPAWIREMDPRLLVVEGGATRAESVRRCLHALPADLDVIAVHDAARPLVSAEAVRRCIDVAEGGRGAVLGCPAVDTMKVVDAEGRVVATPSRASLWHAHTPQVFPAGALRRAYDGVLEGATDDAALAEATGLEILMVDAGSPNLKVTRREDLALAAALLRARRGGP